MSDLVELFVEVGCREVRTLIQSGNVVFAASPEVAAAIPALIAARIGERFGIRVPVVLRTAEDLRDTVCHNPFRAEGAAEETLHVMFLAEQPEPGRVAGLDPERSPPDAFVVRGREILLRLPNGAARTKLTNAWFDAELATTGTQRNWRTVAKLWEMMEG